MSAINMRKGGASATALTLGRMSSGKSAVVLNMAAQMGMIIADPADPLLYQHVPLYRLLDWLEAQDYLYIKRCQLEPVARSIPDLRATLRQARCALAMLIPVTEDGVEGYAIAKVTTGGPRLWYELRAPRPPRTLLAWYCRDTAYPCASDSTG